jgi:hypothetical protein
LFGATVYGAEFEPEPAVAPVKLIHTLVFTMLHAQFVVVVIEIEFVAAPGPCVRVPGLIE